MMEQRRPAPNARGRRTAGLLRSPAGVAFLIATIIVLLRQPTGVSAMESGMSYKKYPSYPNYCSIPATMRRRSIPPLQATVPNLGDRNTKLVQVTAVIRHGARTPYSSSLSCWDGYWTDPATGVWDCELTTLTAPPSPPEVKNEEEVAAGQSKVDTEADAGGEAMFLFDKRYDALSDPPELSNKLNGTCQVGQLILRGYDQELANGKHLRSAYVYDGTDAQSVSHNPRMRLFDATANGGIDATNGRRMYEEPNLVYRADDDQRTLMSGQVLLRGLFGKDFDDHKDREGSDPVVRLHTADRARDVLTPNEAICPRLKEIRTAAGDSLEFQQFNNSKEAETLRKMMVKELGNDFAEEAIDCLMTTICTDRPLPPIVDDFKKEEDGRDRRRDSDRNDGEGNNCEGGKDEDRARGLSSSSSDSDDSSDEGYGTNIFERLFNFSVAQNTYHYRYNDAEYCKLGMGPMWSEIMANILPITSYEDDGKGTPPPTVPKLALFSGHDTTILPLLNTLGPDVWDGEWTPYASMLAIEIHEIVGEPTDRNVYPSNHAFRLVYNGQAITSRMEKCPSDSEMCDISVLLNRVQPFATIKRQCSSLKSVDEGGSFQASVAETEEMLSTTGGIALFVIIALSFASLGSVSTFVYLTRRLPFCSGVGSAHGSSETESFGLGFSLPSLRRRRGHDAVEEYNLDDDTDVSWSDKAPYTDGVDACGTSENDLNDNKPTDNEVI